MDVSSHLFPSRFRILCYALALILLCIIGRLFQLQIKLSDLFFARGQRNFLRSEKILSPRGNILDCFNRPLATNRPITTLYWHGTGKKKLDDNQLALIKTLEELLGKNILDNQNIQLAECSGKRIPLKSDVPFEIFSKLIEQYASHENLFFSTHFKRFYPYKEVACHSLGYLGSIASEPEGKMGLEKIFEEELKGTPGERLKMVNSKGHPLTEQQIKAARSGADLATTIDLDLQMIAEDIFPSMYAGVILIMEPRTGALRVITSRPNFDPNLFVDPLTEEDWHQLRNERQPFINRAFNASYPPASLFKMVTISAALETGLITQESTWYCCGHITFAGRPYHCHRLTGHGSVSTMEALIKSCNIPFYEVAKRIKIDTLADYAHRLGLGASTNSAFLEKTGLIPTSAWKRQTKGEPWWPGETLSAGIGQSFMLATPIQLVCMVSGICEGYLVRPRILSAEPIEKKHVAINHETLQFLKRSMSQVVKRGTGQGARTLGGMEIFAKTGTAQTSALTKHALGPEYLEHAWFVAYIQYKNYEPLTIMILLENAGSSRIATAVARSFLIRYCVLADQRAQSI